jgi:serine/threonine protein kinase
MTGGAGSPRYMAPEVAKRSRVYGMPADVYSFSMLLWQIATKKVPYAEITCPTEFAAQVVNRNLRPNLGLVPSHSLQMIIRQAWSSEPLERPSFAVIVRDLHAVLDEFKLLPRKEAYRCEKLVDKNSSLKCSKMNNRSQHIKNIFSKMLTLKPSLEIQKNDVLNRQGESVDPSKPWIHRLISSNYQRNGTSRRSCQTVYEAGEPEHEHIEL